MNDKKDVPSSARVLNILGIWLALALVVIIIGYIGVVISEETIWIGFKKLRAMLSPFNISNYIAVFATLAPGLGMKTWANRIKKKRQV